MKNAKFWENRIIELMGNIHLCAKIDYILQTKVPIFGVYLYLHSTI